MGRLTEHEATQIWIAAQDHNNAILARLRAKDDITQMKADMELDRAKQNLRAMIGQHVRGDDAA